MVKSPRQSFVSLITGSLVSVALAYMFGTQGVEAFFVVYILTTILFTQQTLWYVRKLLAVRMWRILKIVGALLILLIWLLLVGTSLFPLLAVDIYPRVTLPEPTWWVVLAGITVRVVPLFWQKKEEPDWPSLTLRSTSSLLTIVIMITAFITYVGTPSLSRSILLVLTVELQFVMNFIVLQTTYLQRIQQLILHRAHGTVLQRSRMVTLAQAILMGVPFLIPLCVIFLMTLL